METINCIVTYAGDITRKLKACGSQCQHRLTADGNTEQMVECWKGGATKAMQLEAFAKDLEPIIIQECSENGTVIGCRWAIAESSNVKLSGGADNPRAKTL